MRNVCLCLALLLGTCPVFANSAGDSARPKIGLVLGGGGALGMSHVGILKVLEEQRIPIDYIAGTSMGSIIAGLYASGMSPQEIEDFLKSLDWDEVMRDETPRQELYFRQKADDQRYLFELGIGGDGVKIGTGMAAGQKFNNLMQYITLRVAGITNFDNLPIPYRAVATDLESGKPYVIDHGNLGMAMRASMAVPGAFTPVEMEGHILVDGGVVDNLPVDVARAMGADVIIAVDVGAGSDKVDMEKVKTFGGILGRVYAIAQRPNQVEQFKQADIGIQPVLTGLTASQFDRVSEFIPPGEQAAREKVPELSKYSVDEETYAAYIAAHRRPLPGAIVIGDISVTGNDRVSRSVIDGRIREEKGAPFAYDNVKRDLMRLYGVGEFESILFTLTPESNDTSRINYDVTEKSWGPLYLKYGLQLRSDFESDAEWDMLLNLTRMSINDLGAEWKNELQIGSSLGLFSEFYQPLDPSGIFFVAPNGTYLSRREDVYDGKKHVAQYDIDKVEGELDFGVQFRDYAEFRIGPFWGNGKAKVETGTADLPEFDESYAGLKAGIIVDRQDRTLFARSGYYADIQGSFARESMGGERDFDKLTGNIRAQKSWGDQTVIVGLQGGSALGSDLPGYAQLTLGGPFSFSGLPENQFRGSYLGVGSLGYRYRLLQLPAQLGRAVYVMTRIDSGNVWQDEVDTGDLRVGASAGIGADSALGPLYFGYGRADGGYDALYFSLGTTF